MTTLPAEHGPASAAALLPLVRLLQWSSPTLPVGGFSYSQGLEAAVDAGLVTDAASAGAWIGDVLAGPVGAVEAVFLARMLDRWQALPVADAAALHALDADFQATRESAQLLAETRQMGWALLSLVHGLPQAALGADWPARAERLRGLVQQASAVGAQPSFLLVWAALASASGLSAAQAVLAWLWSWLENQVMAALKTVPLGQNAGQALLLDLGGRLPAVAAAAVAAVVAEAEAPPAQAGAVALADGFPAELAALGPGNYAPGFGLACAQHETQYSRLFRS